MDSTDAVPKRGGASGSHVSLCSQQDNLANRIIFPAFIVINIVLFAWSNASLGAEVYLRVSRGVFGHEMTGLFRTYSFSLVCTWLASLRACTACALWVCVQTRCRLRALSRCSQRMP